ncbi:unnamed protein product [Caenorhabditis angaria]|uniref:Uncharacterized protein n=1 Tax=Caenorhabditis angaria TaxID=860376 RepID=A0A9P1N6C8_9PELO|nr:unnamed protein product [Caenorhabditis angaria]
MSKSVNSFWFMEFNAWRTADTYQYGYDYLRQSLGDSVLRGVLATPFDIALVDETYTSLQGAIALKLREKFGTKIIAFSTTGRLET